mmetsp:Transcript_25153/g.82440  ORF Transcript_25153/g.82440 Transcript_25153/m.82440 type:complete len:201 (+) Transcript_25153:67-669(+)
MRFTSPKAPKPFFQLFCLMVRPPDRTTLQPDGASTTSPGGMRTAMSLSRSASKKAALLRKTRPAGISTSFRATADGKSRKKRSANSPGRPVGAADQPPPAHATSTRPSRPTKDPPSQLSRRQNRPPSASSPGKPRSRRSSSKRTSSGSRSRAPDAAQSLGIHVPSSRPTLSDTQSSKPSTVAAGAASASRPDCAPSVFVA